MANTRSILPTFDVFGPTPSNGAPMVQPGAAASGLGKYRLFALSPVVAAVKGLGADDAGVLPGPPVTDRVTSGDFVWTVAILGIAGVACYQAGKAIAPSREDRTTWGWLGVPVGLFTGVLGLGVMGAVANHRKG